MYTCKGKYTSHENNVNTLELTSSLRVRLQGMGPGVVSSDWQQKEGVQSCRRTGWRGSSLVLAYYRAYFKDQDNLGPLHAS